MTAARASGTDVPSYTETWPCEPESARKVRLLVSSALALWGIAEAAANAELIASELATNAIVHSHSRNFQITIARPDATNVKILVSDTNREVPEFCGPDEYAVSGRGLNLVDQLSTKCGYDRKQWGKVVWAELEVPEVPAR
ncbi:ATP-binding protein [Streptomyces sp. NPDC001508]|uniref:ATP-binding protein n=1 Tax=Streptomyces sp. NPDC001508 TaxID=3154656 RepID=UPI003320B530